MPLNPEEIFADLITFRKEINAPECHCDYDVKPFRFVLYNPSGKVFHFMPCTTIRTANNSGTISNLRRTSQAPRLNVCRNCINLWNNLHPDMTLSAGTFDINKFFLQLEYDSHMWDGINLPPEFDGEEFSRNCFTLYRPVKGSVFHFMKCETVREDEKIGWIRSYRFTDRITGKFEMFDGSFQTLRPCAECLAEWDNGNGWKNYSSAEDDEKKLIRLSFSLKELSGLCEHNIPHEISELHSLMENKTVWFGANVSNEYPGNWQEISTMYRIAQNYRCEECGLDMSQHTELAVVHHVNGSHPEVSPENMRVLCMACHSRQPHHERTVKLDRYTLKLLRQLRREQGIKIDGLP